MKTSTEKKFTGDGNNPCVLSFTGEFTPYWGGVRYYKDGSGQPPEPEEFEIESAEFINGDPLALIDEVQEFYNKQVEILKEKVVKNIQQILLDHNIDPTSLKAKHEIGFIENLFFIDQYSLALGDELAIKLQENLDDSLAAEEKAIDDAIGKLRDDEIEDL